MHYEILWTWGCNLYTPTVLGNLLGHNSCLYDYPHCISMHSILLFSLCIVSFSALRKKRKNCFDRNSQIYMVKLHKWSSSLHSRFKFCSLKLWFNLLLASCAFQSQSLRSLSVLFCLLLQTVIKCNYVEKMLIEKCVFANLSFEWTYITFNT